jgi:hypothetical protein
MPAAKLCATPQCGRPVRAKGLCGACYQRQHYATHPEARLKKVAANAHWRATGDNYQRVLDSNRNSYHKRQTNKRLRGRAAARTFSRTARLGFDREIAHHLAKGRSPASIAVRTNLRVSVVQAAIDRIAAQNVAAPPAP